MFFREMVEAGLQILIFSGDVDAVLPAAGTRFWLNALGFRKVGPWRHWSVNNQVCAADWQSAGIHVCF
jgi:serine carboxypeptidase-like clade 2